MYELVQKVFHDAFLKVLFGSASIVLLGGWAWYKARSAWLSRQYLDRLNFSLNILDGNTLRIRTLMEDSLESVFLNRVAVSAVRSASARATVDDPILHFSKDDAWFILNGVLNALSEKFSTGVLRQDILRNAKGEVEIVIPSARYVFCLTCEKNAQVRTQKIRAMVIRKDCLDSLPGTGPVLERPSHETRWQTLQKMTAARSSHPHDFLEVELSV